MKTLYLDCSMGAAGDMLSASLLDLLPNKEEVIEKLNSLNIPDVHIACENVSKCGINGTSFSVKIHDIEEEATDIKHHHEDNHSIASASGHNHQCTTEIHSEYNHEHSHEHNHHHSSMHDIEHIVKGLALPENVISDILSVYSLIAEAESHVHGVPVTDIHFHEVGTMDAIADITAVCMLMNELSPQKVIVSPICVGGGQVKCAHGILPVPAPATAHLLKGIPIYEGAIKSELCTPTGAALLKHFATEYGNMPVMKLQAIGYGMGKKDFAVVNCVRALLGNTEDKGDSIVELNCNIDDMTPEALSYATDIILKSGALDVFTTSVLMKKSRSGFLLTVLCNKQDKENLIHLIFKHTTTIGIRENICNRYILNRSIEEINTEYGTVKVKKSWGYNVTREKYEYDDLAQIAQSNNLSLFDLENINK